MLIMMVLYPSKSELLKPNHYLLYPPFMFSSFGKNFSTYLVYVFGNRYIFFVTLLSIPESSFAVAFKMFDTDNNG